MSPVGDLSNPIPPALRATPPFEKGAFSGGSMEQTRPKIKYSVRLVFIAIFSVFLAVTVGLLNVYPTTTARDIVFSAKQSSMLSQSTVMSSSLAALERLTPDGVKQVMGLVGAGDYDRVVVTDQDGMILYDSDPMSGIVGTVSDFDFMLRALFGNAVFSCNYDGEVFFSRAAAPVISYGRVIGAVYLSQRDSEQAALIGSIQARLRNISIATGVVALALIILFSQALTQRIRTLVQGMRIVREGDYAYRVHLRGRDEVRELGEEFNDMTGRLQSTDELRRRFVSDASHELRTPLASIRLLSDSIVQSENMDEGTMREFVTDIGSEAERLQRLTEKLMRLTRMDSGFSDASEPVDMKSVAERTIHLLDPLAKKKDVTIYTEFEEGCVISATRDDVYQIIFNLAENAIKYNSFGGNVFLRLHREGGEAVLTVEDTGIGIPEEDVPHIFDRFYRVDKARSRASGGSGLGLSIVLGAVQAHGGTIGVERRETVGTRFTVRFPALDAPAGEEEGEA